MVYTVNKCIDKKHEFTKSNFEEISHCILPSGYIYTITFEQIRVRSKKVRSFGSKDLHCYHLQLSFHMFIPICMWMEVSRLAHELTITPAFFWYIIEKYIDEKLPLENCWSTMHEAGRLENDHISGSGEQGLTLPLKIYHLQGPVPMTVKIS